MIPTPKDRRDPRIDENVGGKSTLRWVYLGSTVGKIIAQNPYKQPKRLLVYMYLGFRYGVLCFGFWSGLRVSTVWFRVGLSGFRVDVFLGGLDRG